MSKRGLFSIGQAFVLALAACGDSAEDTATSSSAAGSSSSGATTGAGGSATTSSSSGGGPSKRVFVTSKTYTGDIGGLAGADAECAALAATAGLGGSWKAWLSAQASSMGPSARFTKATIPYVVVGGAEIASSFAELVDGSIEAPIDHDETGAPIDPTVPAVWTGTSTFGEPMSPCCTDWTATDSGSAAGDVTHVDGGWTFASGANCTEAKHLYCFEQ